MHLNEIWCDFFLKEDMMLEPNESVTTASLPLQLFSNDNLQSVTAASLPLQDIAPTDRNGEWHFYPTFESIVEKINAYNLRPEVRIPIISETIKQILSDLKEDPAIPSFLLAYLCKETVRRVTLRKFNKVLGCECVDLPGLSNRIGDNVAEANKVFSTIRICDPSVRSGKFLQTMLNELIAVKSQLGLLTDPDGNPLYKYKFIAGNDGLTVLDKKDFKPVRLDGSTTESCYIQESLYAEKVALAQQCLFGIGVEHLSVLTCKLRLWLEMISHLDGLDEADLFPVETNIIFGDALVSRFTLNDDLLVALRHINQSVDGYKRLAEKIKTAKAASDRQYLVELMTLVKNRLVEGIGWNSNVTNELLLLRRELSQIMTPGLFPLDEREKELQNERLKLLQAKIKNQEQQIATFRNHPAFDKAVEWRYIFPELLDNKGTFTGFDAMTGILPDDNLGGMGGDQANFYKRMNFEVYKPAGNVSDLFCELANRLLVQGGCMTYIMRSDCLNNKIGEYLTSEMNPEQLILFDDISPYLKDKCALIVQKEMNRYQTVLCRLGSSYRPQDMELDVYIRQFAKPVSRLVEAFGSEMLPNVVESNETYRSIHKKIQRNGQLLKNWDVRLFSGITTGCDQAFIMDKQNRERLVRADFKNADLLKPLLTGDFIKRYSDGIPDHWLLNIPWHFPLQYDKTITTASSRAEQRFQNQYSDVYAYLSQYRQTLSSRYLYEEGQGFEWYALQQSVMDKRWECFSEQKIVWKKDSPDCCFGIDFGGCVVPDDVCFMVGQHLKFLLGVLNSSVGRYLLADQAQKAKNKSTTDINVIESIAIPAPNQKMESDIISLVNRRISENNKSKELQAQTEEKINRLIYELYNLTENEITFLHSPFEGGH